MYDPVPGTFGGRGIHDEVDIHGDEKQLAKYGMAPLKNADTTFVYSLHSDHTLFFTPQKIKGADRVIITPYRHNVGMDQIDESQIRVRQAPDGQEHWTVTKVISQRNESN